jgi:GWxTD domain-containing protein
MKVKILFFSIILQLLVYAQPNVFKVDFDFARFKYDDSSAYVEIYYSFFQPDLTVDLETAKGEQNIRGVLSIKIVDHISGEAVIDKNYQFTNILQPLDTAGDKSLTGNIGFVIPNGDYTMYLVGQDGNDSTRIDTTTFDLSLMKILNDRYSVSDIELAGSIQESEKTNSLFYKNTYEVIPNPSSIYGEPLPVVYFYSEIYNLDKNVKAENLKIEHILLDSQNKQFYRKGKYVPRTNTSIVEVGAINVSKAPSGTYLLVVAVSDSLLGQTIYSSKKLFVYNPGILDTSMNSMLDQDVMSSEFASMSDEELNETFAFSKYVAGSQEINQWDKISDTQAKRSFLFNFWKARDLNINTPVNEYKREYFIRVEKANAQFGTMQKRGWKTDRGRVFITYGEPSEIERYPNQVDTKPYEIWYYNQLEGGVNFIFADLTGFSDYLLIHSSHRSELRDDNWSRKIQTY